MRTWLPILLFVAWIYVAARFAYFLPLGAPLRIVVALVLLVIAEYQLMTRRYFGSLSSAELPRVCLLLLAWAFGGFVLLFVLLVLRDIAGVLVSAAVPHAGLRVFVDPRIAWGIGLLAALLSVTGVCQAVKVPRVKTLAIAVPGLPTAFAGYRIVQLTDLHVSRLLPRRWIAAVVARANALRPDLIVITGDLADGTPARRARDVQPLAGLHAPDGVLAISGNHEYYSDYAGWMTAYRALGLQMLENAHVVIARGDSELAVAGVTDRQARTFGEAVPDLDAALAGLSSGMPIVLLDHRPGNARSNARAGVCLQLSGHTHGGQIIGLHLFAQRSNGGFVSGFYRVGDMSLYVSNGTGLWNGFALRLGRRSEITQIVLRGTPTFAPSR